MKKVHYGILYVEDDLSVAKPFTSILSYVAENVYRANNADEAMELFEEHHPLVVITDIKMPGTDGITLAANIKKQDPKTRLIVMTAHNDAAYLLKAIEIGVDRFYLKPVDTEQLIEYLNRLQKHIDTRRELIHSEHLLKQYREAIDASTIISITNNRGEFIHVNDQYCISSGFSRDELLGRPHSLTRHPLESSEKFVELWDCIRSKQIWHGIIRNKRKDGRTFIVDTTIVPMMDDDENIFEYISLQKDITLQVEQEEELRRLHTKQASEQITLATKINYIEFVSGIPLPAILTNPHEEVLALSEPVRLMRAGMPEPRHFCDLFEHEGECTLIDMGAMQLDLQLGLTPKVRLSSNTAVHEYTLHQQPCGDSDEFTIWYLCETS